MKLENPREITQFVRQQVDACAGQRMQFAQRSARDICYYLGMQFLTGGPVRVMTPTGSLPVMSNPDAKNLRVTQNETTRLAIASAAATFPMKLDFSYSPPDRDGGTLATEKAELCESLINVAAERSGLVSACREANHMRAMIGAYVVGLSMTIGTRTVGLDGKSVPMEDATVRAFCDHPMRLILDPFETSRDLRRHEWVIYESVWTLAKIRRTFPQLRIPDEDKLQTVGQLASNEVATANMTGLACFRKYNDYSQTKGARVYQVHCKGDNGRWTYMYVGVDVRDKDELRVVNIDNPVSPFGGDGLPLALLQGHHQPDSPFGLSDVAMMRSDQDKLNLAATWWHRMAQRSAGWRIIVDKAWLGRSVSDEDARGQFANVTGQVIVGNPAPGMRNIEAPRLLVDPQPTPEMLRVQEMHANKMGEKAFRTPELLGLGSKSHVPFQTTAFLANEGDKVLAIRVQEDITSYRQIGAVLAGTYIKSAQQMNPSTLAILTANGFDESDLAEIMAMDPAMDEDSVVLHESSVRHRTTNEKVQRLTESVQTQSITPDDYRREMAELDIPVTADDKHMRLRILKSVSAVIGGEQWEPLPLGQYSSWLLQSFRRALMDKEAKDPAVRQRLMEAIMSQQQLMAAEAAALAPPGPQGAPGVQADAPQAAVPTTLGDAIEQLALGAA